MPYVYQKNAAGHYVCPHCGITKERQNTMHYHLKKHEGRLPFQCTHCDKEFLQAVTLALHISARHPHAAAASAASAAATSATAPPAFSCPCCEHTALTKANAVLHYLRKHCAEDVKVFQDKSTQPLTCTACQKQCNSSTAYLYHIASSNCLGPTLSEEKLKDLNGLLGFTTLSSQEIREREQEVLNRARARLSEEGVDMLDQRRHHPLAKRLHLLSITSSIGIRPKILDEIETLMHEPLNGCV